MVNFWDEEIKEAIKRTKMRITLMEKHGVGLAVIEEKEILKKQLRTQELRKK